MFMALTLAPTFYTLDFFFCGIAWRSQRAAFPFQDFQNSSDFSQQD